MRKSVSTLCSKSIGSDGYGYYAHHGHIASSGIVLAHIGDSRIYHLRKGEILYQTEDHSFNSLK